MTATTPVRSATLSPLPAIDAARHPFPARLLSMLAGATDLSSSSDELELACTDWFDRYHVSSTRANVLRGLALPADSVVLELGPGGGAVTRHLGETFAAVDAVEPDPALAAVAARRCADLDSVAVHAGWLDDIATEPTYDLVVALDVLGEIELRGDDLAGFVARCRALLTPRGVLVIGADNRDGVRFLAGDATPRLRPDTAIRPPRAGRDELEDAVRAAGLVPRVLSAFPDHRSPRTLFDHDALAAVEPQLLTALPSFPSPPYDGPNPAASHESALWTGAIAAGTGRAAANGLVVLASRDGAELLDGIATYWSMGRRAALSATNQIVATADGAVVRRSLTFPEAPADDSPLRLRPHDEAVTDGTPLTERLARLGDIDEVAALLQAWSALVDRSTRDGEALAWDLIPRNVLVLDDGSLRAFDQEWSLDATPGGADLIRSRGAFWLAYDLMFRLGSPSWLRGGTVAEAADVILRLAHPTTAYDWHRTFVDRESTHMSYVWPTTSRRTQPAAARRERNNVSSLSNTPPPGAPEPAPSHDPSETLREVVDSLAAANAELRAENEALRIQQRHTVLVHRDHTVGLVQSAEMLKDRLERAHAENRRQKARANRLQKQVTAMRTSATWRVGRALVRPFAAIARVFRR